MSKNPHILVTPELFTCGVHFDDPQSVTISGTDVRLIDHDNQGNRHDKTKTKIGPIAKNIYKKYRYMWECTYFYHVMSQLYHSNPVPNDSQIP